MKHILPLLAVSVTVTLTSCNASSGDTQPSDRQVRISPIISRVSGLNFDTGDRIGLTIERTAGRYADNAPLTYDGAVFTSPDLIWYNDQRETSALYAYYPYLEEGTPTRFTIRSDQRRAEDYASSDLLAAAREEVAPAASAIDMQFVHMMSRLTVLIDNRSDAAVEKVCVAGTVCTAEVDIAARHAAADGTASPEEISARESETGKTFDAILVPQVTRLTVSVLTADGKRHEKTLAEERDLRQGCRYKLDVTVTNIDISVSLGGAIQDWEEGESLDPEQPEDRIQYAGATYRIHTFQDGTCWMADNLRYLPDGCVPSEDPSAATGIWYPCSQHLQAAKDEQTILMQGYLYDLQTAAGIAVTEANLPLLEGTQGICPEGWHLPTRSDLDRLGELAVLEPDIAEDFFTRAGIRAASGSYSGQYVGSSFTKGYLLGTSVSGGVVNGTSKFRYLCIQSGGSVTTVDYAAEAGVPVRCVRD